MKYRRLGKTDLKVSVIGIGTYQYGGEWGKSFTLDEVKRILERSSDLGLNLIDTAECYGDHLSEALIGEALKGSRHKWTVATKFGHRFKSNFGREAIWDAKGVLTQLEDSLKALQTDYIDMYMFHSGGNNELNNDELWTLLHKQVDAGKIRHLGISLSPAVTDNLYQTETALGLGIETIEILYNRLDRNPEKEVFQLCRKNDFGVLARVPLASGYLSGKYKPGAEFVDSDVRSVHDRIAVDLKLKQVEEIKKNEVPENLDMAQWAIAWCLQHDAVSTCIPGFKSVEQLESGAKAAGLDMVSDKHPQAWK